MEILWYNKDFWGFWGFVAGLGLLELGNPIVSQSLGNIILVKLIMIVKVTDICKNSILN